MELTEWMCPYCSKRYAERSDAQECAENCVTRDIDRPIKVVSHSCEICTKSFGNKKHQAEQCEATHKERGDNAYLNFQDAKSREKLQKAAESPFQQQLPWRVE